MVRDAVSCAFESFLTLLAAFFFHLSMYVQ
jgi:hypothetical protein